MLTLQRAFAKKKPASRVVEETVKSRPVAVTSIIDGSRERNVGIVLQFLRISVERIQEAIEALDSETLSEDAVHGLLSVFPSSEEQQLVLNCAPERRKSLCARFFLMCAQHTRYESRLRCWLTVTRFANTVSTIRASVEAVNLACTSVMDSVPLRHFLHFLLLLGNQLNDHVPTLRTAAGFHLRDVFKTSAVTDVNYDPASGAPSSKHSLLAFAVRLWDGNVASVLALSGGVEIAAKLDIVQIEIDLRELVTHLELCKRAVLNGDEDFRDFSIGAERTVNELKTAIGDLNKKCEALHEYFVSKDEDTNQLFGILAQFLLDLGKC